MSCALDLNRFRPAVQEQQPEPAQSGNDWDPERAVSMISSLFAKVEMAFPAGAYAWAEDVRPDLLEAVKAGEQAIDRACEAEDIDLVRTEVTAYGQRLRELFEAFETMNTGAQQSFTGM